MNSSDSEMGRADRLCAIATRIGFTLWQLQQLEGAVAQYLVLKTQAKPGMGLLEGNALVEKAQSGTFGTIVKKLIAAKAVTADVEGPLQDLVRERNWLVHDSLRDSRSAVHSDNAMHTLLDRVDAMAEAIKPLLSAIGVLAEAHVKTAGVTDEQIRTQTERTLREWHGGRA